ncbi:MAG: O-antigen ligase family protein, partial [Acidimicrobiia bacterium]|nr:O-antigen ligase family protein [Acidimicrobiia bacterium]
MSSAAVGLVAFTGAGALSAVGATDVSASFVEAARLAAGCAMVVVLDRLVDRPSVAARCLTAALAATALPALVGLAQAVTNGGRVDAEGVSRVSGTFAHPNAFALHLAMVLVMAFALLPRVVPRLRPVLLGAVVLDAGLLLLTYSRSGWVAAAAGIAVVGVLQSRRLLVAVVAAAVAAALLVPGVSGRLGDLGDERAVTGGAGNSFVWRLDHWREAIPLANGNPVTGIGLGMVQEQTSTEKVLHNDVLRAYVETGVVGAIAYLGFLGGLIAIARGSLRRATGLRREGEEGWRVGAAVGLCGVVAVFVVFSVGGNAITQVVQLWVLAALMAAGAAATRPEPAPDSAPAMTPERIVR